MNQFERTNLIAVHYIIYYLIRPERFLVLQYIRYLLKYLFFNMLLMYTQTSIKNHVRLILRYGMPNIFPLLKILPYKCPEVYNSVLVESTLLFT